MGDAVTAMAPALARLALAQWRLTQVLELVAYVEGFGLVVGSLGIALHPPRVVPEVIAVVVEGRRPWEPHRRTFPAHVRTVARAVLVDRVRLEATTRTRAGGAVEDVRMSVVQVGGVSGVAELAHCAGEHNVFVRADDAAMLTAAVVVCDLTRTRLELIAAADGGADAAPVMFPPRLRRAPAPGIDAPTAAVRPRHDEPTPRGRRTERSAGEEPSR